MLHENFTNKPLEICTKLNMKNLCLSLGFMGDKEVYLKGMSMKWVIFYIIVKNIKKNKIKIK
jgi:hypothetical protein